MGTSTAHSARTTCATCDKGVYTSYIYFSVHSVRHCHTPITCNCQGREVVSGSAQPGLDLVQLSILAHHSLERDSISPCGVSVSCVCCTAIPSSTLRRTKIIYIPSTASLRYILYHKQSDVPVCRPGPARHTSFRPPGVWCYSLGDPIALPQATDRDDTDRARHLSART